MRTLAFPLLVLLCVSPSRGQDAQSIATEKDRQQIEKAATSFVEAFNKHDVKAVTELFTDDAEFVERRGDRFVGREEIAAAFAEAFEESPKSKISLTVDSLRFVTPDVAVEEGMTTWFPDGETPTVDSVYRVAHVRHDGKWLMAGSRTIDDEVLTSYEYLRDLQWIIGDWVDESHQAAVVTSVRWSPNRAFLLRDFSVQMGGQTMLKGTQRIGWDARKQQFRSWTFDSEGGFVEGLWTRVGDGYVIRSDGFLRDGTAVSGTTRFDPITGDRFSWSMFNRLRGDEIMPDVDLTIVRKPPVAEAE